MLRRLRAIAVTAVLWGLAWGALGVVFGTVAWILGPGVGNIVILPRFLANQVLFWGLWGGISGGAFATLLALGERRHSLDELRGLRIAGWGALGGMLIPLGVYLLLTLRGGPIFGALRPTVIAASLAGLLGAGLAAGQLALARRAPGALPRGRPALPPE